MKTKSKNQNGKPGKSQLNAPTTEAWLRRISGSSQPVKDTLAQELTASSAKVFGMFDAAEKRSRRQPIKPGNGAKRPLVLRGILIDHVKIDMDTHYLVLPASEAAHEARVDKAHAAIAADPDYKNIAHHQWLDLVNTVLRSIGDTPVKMEGGK